MRALLSMAICKQNYLSEWQTVAAPAAVQLTEPLDALTLALLEKLLSWRMQAADIVAVMCGGRAGVFLGATVRKPCKLSWQAIQGESSKITLTTEP